MKNTDAYSKANAAYAVGGPEQAVRMLNTNLDLDIQEYVSFDFSAVAEAVDILGGVEVEITNEEAGHPVPTSEASAFSTIFSTTRRCRSVRLKSSPAV